MRASDVRHKQSHVITILYTHGEQKSCSHRLGWQAVSFQSRTTHRKRPASPRAKDSTVKDPSQWSSMHIDDQTCPVLLSTNELMLPVDETCHLSQSPSLCVCHPACFAL